MNPRAIRKFERNEKLERSTPRNNDNGNDDLLKAESMPCVVCLHFKREFGLDEAEEGEYRSHLDRSHGMIP